MPLSCLLFGGGGGNYSSFVFTSAGSPSLCCSAVSLKGAPLKPASAIPLPAALVSENLANGFFRRSIGLVLVATYLARSLKEICCLFPRDENLPEKKLYRQGHEL